MTDDIEEVEVEILPNDNCKDIVATGEIVDDKMKDALHEADEKNSKRIADDLKELGDEYENAMKRLCEAKLSCKSLIDRGKEIGITKVMIETYISMKKFNNLNRFAVMNAIGEDNEEEPDYDEQ